MEHTHSWQTVEITAEVLETVRQLADGIVVIDPDEENMDLGYIIEGYDEEGISCGPVFHRIKECNCGAYLLYQQGGDYAVVVPASPQAS